MRPFFSPAGAPVLLPSAAKRGRGERPLATSGSQPQVARKLIGEPALNLSELSSETSDPLDQIMNESVPFVAEGNARGACLLCAARLVSSRACRHAPRVVDRHRAAPAAPGDCSRATPARLPPPERALCARCEEGGLRRCR